MSKNNQSEKGVVVMPEDDSKMKNGRVLSYRGPLPLAEEIERYESVVPGSADRIIKMAENQQGHRHKIEDRTVWFIGFQSLLAPIFSFLTIILGMGIGTYLLLNGVTGAGIAAMFIPLSTIAGIFVYQKRTENKEED